jgi:predicted RNA binding protein YcfA (HicA-like mRNA interferase family)
MKAVSGKDMRRILLKRGWVLLRVTGSHHIFGLPGNPAAHTVVPVHGSRSLSVGTQRNIMQAAGLTEDDL